MDSDATALQNSLAILHRHYGAQLTGSRERTEAQMRGTLQEQMGLDEPAVDHVLKRLQETEQLLYVADPYVDSDVDADAGTDETGTGPVISMPLTQSADGGAPLITSASPAMVMGIVDYEGGNVSEIVESDFEVVPQPLRDEADADVEGDHSTGYWRIG